MNNQEALERFEEEKEHQEWWAEYRKHEDQLFSKHMLLTLEITHKCYLKCRHCFAESSSEKNDFLDAELIERLAENSVDIFFRYDGGNIRITGGDPFLHPQLFDIVKSFSSRNDRSKAHIDVETSGGWAVSDEITRKIVGKSKNAGVGLISMTNDGYHREQKVFDNSEYFMRIDRICKEEGMKFRGILVNLPVDGTLSVKDGGLDFLSLVTPIGRARNLPENYWSGTLHQNECRLRPWDYCFDPTIDPYGNVYLCASGKCFDRINLSVGNLHDNSITEILGNTNSPIIELLRGEDVRGLSGLVGLSLVEHYELLDKMGPCGLCHEMLREYGCQISERLGVC